MDGFKESELLAQLQELKNENRELKSQNMKMKVTMDDFGISSEDMEEIPDAEVIAMQQLERLLEISESGIQFTKEEADVYKILTKALMDIRGGTIKRKKKQPKGKELSDDDLIKQWQVIQGQKDKA